MVAGQLIDFLSLLDPNEEVCIEVEFPEVGGWVVPDTAYSVGISDTDGWPCLKVAIYGTDFDYPYPEKHLKALAEEFLHRIS